MNETGTIRITISPDYRSGIRTYFEKSEIRTEILENLSNLSRLGRPIVSKYHTPWIFLEDLNPEEIGEIKTLRSSIRMLMMASAARIHRYQQGQNLEQLELLSIPELASEARKIPKSDDCFNHPRVYDGNQWIPLKFKSVK